MGVPLLWRQDLTAREALALCLAMGSRFQAAFHGQTPEPWQEAEILSQFRASPTGDFCPLLRLHRGLEILTPQWQDLLDEALATLSGSTEVQVFLRAEDLPLAQALQASCGGARRLTFREGGFQLGGLVAESEQLGLRVDSSFDSAAGELSGHFAELFGISLSDDDSPEGGNAQ